MTSTPRTLPVTGGQPLNGGIDRTETLIMMLLGIAVVFVAAGTVHATSRDED